jgi:hypothetical protein
MHALGHFSVSLNKANQINMSKLDKRLPKNAKMFCDHPSIISVGNDVQSFFLYISLTWPLTGANQINKSKFDKRVPKKTTDKGW